MKKIKFRGKSIWTGRMVFGDLIHNNEGEPEICYLDDNKVRAAGIYPGKFAQFIGYDKNGNEIYDGDILIDSEGNSVKFKMAIVDDEFGIVVGNVGDIFEELTL